jgi:hypothetical protein
MKRFSTTSVSSTLIGLVLILSSLPLCAQSDPGSQVARTYPYSVEAVKRCLQQVGAGGGKLPEVDGFVSALVADVDHYERPYYQYRVQVDQGDGNSATVKVEARITAWFAGTDPAHSQYRALPSNGRLEGDLLDRLQEALAGKSGTHAETVPAIHPTVLVPGEAPAAPPAVSPQVPKAPAVAPKQPAAPTNPQEQLDALLTQRQEVRDKTAAALAKLDALKAADDKSSQASPFASVKHSGVGVMSRKNYGGPVLFRAQVEDEFEVQSAEGGWATVKLADGSTGYIQADELNLPASLVNKPETTKTPEVAEGSKPANPDLDFWVSREDVNVFSGDWARLKGKKVLFVYAQPRGLLSDIAGDDTKLAYAKRIFMNRLRSVDQSAGVEGVVVVFLGNRGGVAAATLADIQQWVAGGLGDEAFVNRCSLDPPAEFRHIRVK